MDTRFVFSNSSGTSRHFLFEFRLFVEEFREALMRHNGRIFHLYELLLLPVVFDLLSKFLPLHVEVLLLLLSLLLQVCNFVFHSFHLLVGLLPLGDDPLHVLFLLLQLLLQVLVDLLINHFFSPLAVDLVSYHFVLGHSFVVLL